VTELLESRRLLSAAVIAPDVLDGPGLVVDEPPPVTSDLANTPPVANDDSVIVEQDKSTTFFFTDFVLNDTDAEDASDQLRMVTGTQTTPAGGSVTILDEIVVYTAPDGFSGADSFTYLVRDTQGAVSELPATVDVRVNANPVISADAASVSGNEGQLVTNSGSFSDPDPLFGPPTVSEASVGTVVASNGHWTWSYTPDDNADAPTSVQITAKDDLGSVARVTFNLNIANVAPTAEFVNGGGVNEGSAGSVSFQNPSDPSAADTTAGFKYSYDFDNDGTFEITGSDSPTATVPGSVLAAGQGDNVVRGRISDKDGGFTDYTTTIQVANVAPVVTLSDTELSVNEGASISATGSFTDPGADTWTASVDYGDGSGAQGLVVGADHTFALHHTYTNQGNFTVTVTVNDGTTSGTAQMAVAVSNVDPTAVITGPGTAEKGQPVTFHAEASDAGDDTLSYAWTARLDGVVVASGDGEDFTFTPSAGGTYAVRLNVTDGDGGSASATKSVEVVGNTPPTLGALTGPSSGVRGQLLTYSASLSDADLSDTHLATVDWGDGTTSSGTVTFANGSGAVTASHFYWASGPHTVTLTVTDSGGASVSATASVSIRAAEVQPDPAYPGKTALFVGGTDSADLIVVAPACDGGLEVWVDGGLLDQRFEPTGRVVVYAGAGNDLVYADAGSARVWLYGEAGNDALGAGDGGSIIIGGAGDDLLVGGRGRDIIVGGEGADLVFGNPGDDILVSAVTDYDDRFAPNHDAAWKSIYREWNDTSHTFRQRVDNIRDGSGGTATRANGSYFLSESTIHDDASVDSVGTQDVLTGSSGSDWFIYKSGEDKVTSMTRVETFEDLPIG
jgi:hypothetical protein